MVRKYLVTKLYRMCTLQGVATLLLYPHFEPLRQIDGNYITAGIIMLNTLIIKLLNLVADSALNVFSTSL